jgi:small subunit ribosomal protein S20
MANHASAKKRNRQRIRRTERNRACRSAVRTDIKKARTALNETEFSGEAAATLVKAAESALDRAASKGVLHPRAASRRKSRLARALAKALAAALDQGGPFSALGELEAGVVLPGELRLADR